MSDFPVEADRHPRARLIAVSDDALEELLAAALVREIPTLRGPVLDAALVVGAHAATLVTLMQTPETLTMFADWIVMRGRKRREAIELTAQRRGRKVHLRVDGDVPVSAVTEFLVSAFAESDSNENGAGS